MVSNGFPSGPYTHDEHGIPIIYTTVKSYPDETEDLKKKLADKDRQIRELRSEVFRLRNEARRKR